MSIQKPFLLENSSPIGVPACTIVDVLRWRAETQPEREIYKFLSDDRTEADSLTYARLDLRARAIASWLQAASVPGDRVLLLFPPGLDFIAAFFGCLYAKTVPVPAYPPRTNRSFARLHSIVENARPAIALTVTGILNKIKNGLDGPLAELRFAAAEAIDAAWSNGWKQPDINPHDLAFLQYTSGSTSTPKGVMVTHQNLIYNEAMIQLAFQQDENSVIVGWLPLFHDMGLIGNVLLPLYAGAQCVLLSPMTFLQRPAIWLETISKYRATTSGGPNSAYELCIHKAGAEQCQSLDLSCWSVAFNGSETVHHQTMERFTAAFAGCGFRPEAFYPCYGLAEATLFVSGGAAERPAITGRFKSSALSENRVVPAMDEATDARTHVSCGHAWLEQQVVIADPISYIPSEPGKVGEIWVSGPNVAAGYWNDPHTSANTFLARLANSKGGPYLRTGDLGFIENGELYVTGRLKDVIIIRGRNYYPQDIERTLEHCHPALRLGGCAAFSVEVDTEERLVIVHEIKARGEQDVLQAMEAMRTAVAEEHELQVYAIAFIKPGTLEKTSSGKVRRQAIKSAYRSGSLEAIFQWQIHSLAEDAAAPQENKGRNDIGEWIIDQIATDLGFPRRQINLTTPILSYGLDSLAALKLSRRIEECFAVFLPVSFLLQDTTIVEIVAEIDKLIAQPSQKEPEALSGQAEQGGLLSYGQESLWFLHQFTSTNAAYNVSGLARVSGHIDSRILAKAFQDLTERHPLLRVRFESREGRPAQIIQEDVTVSIVEEDVSALDERQRRQRVEQVVYEPFDLETGPVFRLRWFVRPGEKLLLLVVHHIAVDLWSIAILMQEWAKIYEARVSDTKPALFPLTATYSDYVNWQKRMLAGPEGERLWAHWQEKLSGELPVLALPVSKVRSAAKTCRGCTESLQLRDTTVKKLNSLCRKYGTTLFTTLMAAYQTLLSRYTGQEELLVGSPAACRTDSRFQSVVGYFVNTVVIRATASRNLSFVQFLAQVRRAVLDAMEHQEYPFALLAHRLHPDRDGAASPVFQTMFMLQKAPLSMDGALMPFALGRDGGKLPFGSAVLESVNRDGQPVQFDLAMAAGLDADRLTISLQYHSELFESGLIRRMLENFEVLLESIVGDPEQRLIDLSILTEAERRQHVAGVNPASGLAVSGTCLHQLIERQARDIPDAVAVAWEDEQLTYEELARRAGRLACRLQQAGIAPEKHVGILLERNIGMVIGLLGTLIAGGAYVPLDPAYPVARLAFMLKDAGANVLLTQQNLLHLVPEFEGVVIRLDEPPDHLEEPLSPPANAVTGSNLAYTIYTSGSTGVPKGVAIEHRSAAALVHWAGTVYQSPDLKNVLFSTSICFDLSIFELFVPLSRGGKVTLVKDILLLPACCHADSVTLINTVPSALEALLDQGRIPDSVATLNLAGEPLSRQLVDRAYKNSSISRVFNLYGPSEDTTYSTVAYIQRESTGQPTIGVPIANSQIYVTRWGGLLPLGITGDLLIGGAGLARCYAGHPELTAEKFVPDPYGTQPGGRLYRTGDLGRHRKDGNIEFLGRVDHQVKIRGFRIELAEIESVLSSYPAIKDAAVVAREDRAGDKRIVAYLVAQTSPILHLDELRAYLKEKLPHYMVPQAFVMLEALPLTRNGKVDRRALPEPSQAKRDGAEGPLGSIEEIIAGIWGEVLGLEQVNRQDNFFDLGGHSLNSAQVMSRVFAAFHLQLPLPKLFEAPVLCDFARTIEEALATRRVAYAPIERAARDGGLALSFAQHRLWFLHCMEPESAAYNNCFAVRFSGEINLPALEQGMNEIIRRHEILRTTFTQADSGPMQVIAPELRLAQPLIDLRGLAEKERTDVSRRLLRELAQRPFNLEQLPLLHIILLQLRDSEYLLFLGMHHIICDGWSYGVLLRELNENYHAFDRGLTSEKPELAVQFADYAVWQHKLVEQSEVELQLSYWRHKLAEAPMVTELPADFPRFARQSPGCASVQSHLSPALFNALRKLAREGNATLFMVLLAAFQTLLTRYTQQTDLVIGTPVAGRGRMEAEPLIGCFVNTLPMRTVLSPKVEFRTLLGQVRDTTLEAYANQDVPFEKILTELKVDRNALRLPLVQVMMVLQNAPLSDLQLDGIRLDPEEIANGAAKFDLVLHIAEVNGAPRMKWEYAIDLFKAATIERMAGHFNIMLESIAAGPGQRISELNLLTASERRHLVTQSTKRASADQMPVCVHQRFEQQVERNAERVAVTCGQEQLTYMELNRRANQLACYLRKQGVETGALVSVCLERSLDMVVAILGILKAGAAYVPLDPRYPPDRLKYLLMDTSASIVITQSELRGLFSDGPARPVFMDTDWNSIVQENTDNPLPGTTPQSAAYVIYTSGSTGKPKGVVVSHNNVVRLFDATYAWFEFTPMDVWTLFHSYAFDFSVWELWGALLYGGRLVVVPYWVSRSPEALYELLKNEGVSVLNQTPSAFRQLSQIEEENDFRPEDLALRLVIFGGEALEMSSLGPWLARHGYSKPLLVNMYGITETTVHVTYRPITADVAGAGQSLIGTRIPDLQVYIMDESMHPVPAGGSGELYVGGEGVAHGYWNRPELTALRFVPHPFDDTGGKRLYRTGDRARYVDYDEIEYLGRIDHQIKIRGHRIELGEIEAALYEHHAVQEAMVMVRENNERDKQLIAYAVLKTRATDPGGELLQFLRKQLPEYMVPHAVVLLERFPLTVNGKIDRNALPEPERGIAGQDYRAPGTEAEKLLAAIWSDVLSVKQVGVNDNFFRLGGDSILSIQVVARAKKSGLNLNPRQIFQYPTIAELAAAAGMIGSESGAHNELAKPVPPAMTESSQMLSPGGQYSDEAEISGREIEQILSSLQVDRNSIAKIYPLTPLQQGMLFHVLDAAGSGMYISQQIYTLRGDFKVPVFKDAFQKVIDRHDALRTAFVLTSYGRPFQIVFHHAALLLNFHDWRNIPLEDQDGLIKEFLADDRKQNIEISNVPLMRATVLRLRDDLFQFIWSFHLMILDGWSIPVILKEILFFYGKSISKSQGELPAAVPYERYVEWLRQQNADRAKDFWQRMLKGFAKHSKLGDDRKPTQAARNPESYKEGVLILNERETSALRSFAVHERLTLNTMVQAAWALHLARTGGTDDVVFGAVVSGRPPDLAGAVSIVGLFLNTLPVRVQLPANIDVVSLLRAIQAAQVDARNYEYTSAMKIQACSEIPLGSPLFESVVIFQNIPVDVSLSTAALKFVEMRSTERNHYPLTLIVVPGSQLRLKIVYDEQRFNGSTIQRKLEHIRRLLLKMAASPAGMVSSLSVHTDAERLELLNSFNRSLETI